MIEINTFNELFPTAREHSARLGSLHQLADGRYVAQWLFDNPPRGGPSVVHARPFDAARDAFLALLGEATPAPTEDLFA